MSEPSDELQFEHATYAEAPAGVVCGTCKKPVQTEYWQWCGRVTCPTCRDGVRALEQRVNAPATFARAALLGAGTALGCGVGYALLVGLIHTQFALVTIGIAYVVASVIRKATANISGRRYQILAVALTYAASTMGYAPQLWRAVTASGDRDQHAHVAPDGASDPPPPSREGASSAAPGTPAFGLLKAVVIPCGLLLASPFLSATEAPIGLLIVGFGLWEAWRRAQGIPMVVTGPYRVTTTPP